MDAEQWNTRHPIGTPVMAYPGARPEHHRNDTRLETRTRSMAWELGHGAAVVKVDGYAGGICLTHVDVIQEADSTEVERQLLTRENYPEVDQWLDQAGVFAKAYTRYMDGALTTIGWRIGQYPDHLVAHFGDTIVRHSDGAYTVRRIIEPSEVS